MLTLSSKKPTNELKANYWDLIPGFILVLLAGFIAYKNYMPGTWLSGWDNLHPELNPVLNIGRSFSAVWQEYQGLGLLGGMAHAADLPRQIILGLFSYLLPLSTLRYFWTFLMLILGPLGIYFLIKSLLKEGGALSRFSGLAGAIFYIFNLATLQIFYTPFETFTGFYGFVPWLLFFAVDYLKSGEKKKLLFYALVSTVATGAFYVQTLFIVYAFFLLVFSAEAIVKYGKSGIVRFIKICLITLFINAFWLGPAAYFSLTSAQVPANSHINSIATPETQLMNLARADFENIATFKGYWFDYFDWKGDGSYDYLYKNWIGFVSTPKVERISLTLFLASVAGIIFSLLKRKTSFGLSFLVLLGSSYFMLSGGNIIRIPLFSEIFRNAFTKWANALVLISSVGLGFLIFIAADIIRNKIKYLLAAILSLVIIFAGVYTTGPVLSGKLIADSMKINLPSYYLETINYFKKQDATKRIADFPLTGFWGWKFNDWGYGGSGFLWYGIPQPMLDRTFDVWSFQNETFYDEVWQAVISEDGENLKYVFKKYQVSYVLFDESLYKAGSPNSFSELQKQKVLLDSLDIASVDAKFGKITIYKVNSGNINFFVSTPQINYQSPYVSLGQTGDLVLKEDFSDSQGYSQPKNCNLKGLGNVVKKKIDGGNYYQAEDDGVSCDYFYYPILDPSKAYLMKIKGENISGRSLKLYLYSADKQAIVLEELLPVGNFDKSYYVLPIAESSKGSSGYTLNVETRSFGRVASENIIEKIEFYPVDFNILSPEINPNNITVKNVQKVGTWLYKIDVQGGGLIELGQGYNDGWLAVARQPNLKFLDHIKVNGWANGWVIPEQSTTSNQQSTIIIFFWPQLLEFLGLGIAAGTIIFLLLTKPRR